MCLWSEWWNHILSSSRFLDAISQWLEWSLFTSHDSNSDDGTKTLNWQGLCFGDTRGKAEGFMFHWRHFSWFNYSCSQDSRVKSRWEEQQRQGQTYMHPLWQVGHFMEKCYKLVGFPPGYKQEGKVSMANQVTLDGDSGQSEAASQSGSFPFIAEQCQ